MFTCSNTILISVLNSVGLELVTVILVSSVKRTGLDLLFIMLGKSIVCDVRLVAGVNILEWNVQLFVYNFWLTNSISCIIFKVLLLLPCWWHHPRLHSWQFWDFISDGNRVSISQYSNWAAGWTTEELWFVSSPKYPVWLWGLPGYLEPCPWG